MSSKLNDMSVRAQRLAYMLEIDGVEYVWYDSPYTPTRVGRTERPGLFSVSDNSTTLDPHTNTLTGGGCSVRIALTDTNGAAELLRLGPMGSTHRTTLASSYIAQSSTAPAVVQANDDLSGWPATGVFYMGQECFQYNARTTSPPYIFNVVTRGYLGSEVQSHRSSEAQGWAPPITSECVSWIRRRARLLVAPVMAHNTHGEWVEELSGYVAASPTLASDGLSVTVKLASWVAALKRDVGGKAAQTGLQQGAHIFDGVSGHRVSFTQAVRGVVVAPNVTANQAAGPTIPADTRSYSDVFDVTLPTDHPRHRPLLIPGSTTRYDVTAVVPTAFTVTPNHPGVSTVQIVKTIADHRSEEFRVGFLAPDGVDGTLKAWPDAIPQLFASDFNPHTNKGASGLWIDMQYNEARARVEVRCNSYQHRADMELTFSQRRATNPTVDCLFGCDLGDPQAPGGLYAPTTQNPRASEGSWGNRVIPITVRSDDGGRQHISVQKPPRAFWQTGEKYLYVEDDVFSAAPFRVLVKAQHPRQDDYETSLWITAKASASSIYGAGVPGVVLTTDPNDRFARLPFGDFEDFDAAVIMEDASWVDEAPTTIMLELLMSGEGNGFNHADYDNLPFGVNLPSAYVDIESFTDFPLHGLAQNWKLRIDDSVNIEELIRPILYVLSAAIVPRVNPATGLQRLTLIKLGLPVHVDSTSTIENGDWVTEPGVVSRVNEDIINVLNIKTNYHWLEKKHQVELTATNRDSVSAFNTTRKADLDLRGVTLGVDTPQGQRTALIPLIAEQFALRAYPRREFVGTVALADVLNVHVGSVVTVSDSFAFGVTGTRGVSAEAMRVVGLKRSPARGLATLTLVAHGVQSASGWAPCLNVASVSSTTKLRVDANAFSATTDPLTGEVQTDLDFFEVGDVCFIRQKGDSANDVAAATVSSLNRSTNDIGFAIAHGVTMPRGAHVVSESYSTATAHHLNFVFLSDDLGAQSGNTYA